ncbi:MFS transporter [Salarchaeum japonicum]|uniref:Major facilitator superfamily (MFS) profile domain-containing protein n=1 Tax=Salarchaeum japonicum TaxID=555573 RepID=A0AAV3T0V1_9EURY|nr:MFS transporter [Salarchaeum japonicum]
MTVRETLADLDALVLAAGIWFLAKFLRYAFPPLFPAFSAEYGVSNAALGLAFTAMMLVYAGLQFPSGALADRLGRVPVIAAGAVVAAAGALALSVDVPYLVLVAAMVLVGAGTGVHKTVAVGLLSATYPSRTGRSLGVLDTFGAFGGVVAPAAVLVLAEHAGWHAVFLPAGLLGLALAAVFVARVDDPEQSASDSGGGAGVRAYLGLFRDARFSAFVLVTVGFSFAYNGVVAFLPLYLTDAASVDGGVASLLYSGLFLVSLVQPVTGELADRFSRIRVVAGTLALAAVGLAALLLTSAPLVVVAAGVVAFGLGSHGFRPVRGAYLLDLVPDSMAGGGLGVVRTILMGAGALAPAVVGVVSESVSYVAAFALLLASLAVAAAVAVALAVSE